MRTKWLKHIASKLFRSISYNGKQCLLSDMLATGHPVVPWGGIISGCRKRGGGFPSVNLRGGGRRGENRQNPSKPSLLPLGPIFFGSSLMGSLAKGLLRKVCRNSAESSWLFAKNAFIKGQERVLKCYGKFAEISRNFFCNHPFPNDPISELLIKCRTGNSRASCSPEQPRPSKLPMPSS